MSRDGLVVDELVAAPSVNEQIDLEIKIVSRHFVVCDSKIDGTFGVNDVWATTDNRRRKILE